MHTFKRLAAYGGLTGLVAALALAIPASANVKGDCFLDGVLKVADKHDPDLGVRVSGGQAKFTFASLTFNCVADTNKDLIPEVVSGLQLAASGWIDNTVCGTGKAFGTVDQIRGPTKFQTVVGEAFAIQFVANTGVFKWRDWDKPDMPTPKVSNPDWYKSDEWDAEYTPAGTFSLTTFTGEGKPFPTPEQTLENLLIGNCAKAFRLTGSFAVDFNE